VGFLNAAEHDGMMHAVFLKGMNELIELADLDPVDTIDMVRQLGICFPFVRNSGNLVPQLPRIVRKDNGKPAVAGNQTQPLTAAD
jgi:hypothetical protein